MNPLTRISFEVPGEPVAKERPRTNMATGVVYTPAKTKNYEETVKWCYQMAAHGARFPDNEPLSMLVVAYRPIPKSASAKKKSLMRAGAERPITKPDWDNVGKIVSDALNGIAYRDDSERRTSVTSIRRARSKSNEFLRTTCPTAKTLYCAATRTFAFPASGATERYPQAV